MSSGCLECVQSVWEGFGKLVMGGKGTTTWDYTYHLKLCMPPTCNVWYSMKGAWPIDGVGSDAVLT